ncbi:MAG: hypothetical protein LUC33_04915 [Prevotellaceae bacterium]|nr:hypothetical protein [Prevotellaceae bacterium]
MIFGGKSQKKPIFGSANDAEDVEDGKPVGNSVDGRTGRAHRRTTACLELSQRYEYRRAFSEVSLLDAMRHVTLKDGHSYNFITAGDVDSLSYVKVVLNQHSLDHLILSTWCMAAEDILQVREWHEAGRIRRVDMYLGEIFPGSYRVEWQMVRDFYRDHPGIGRAAIFRNHSKIYAGCNEADGFFFGVQTSANINTNPRTENGCITVDRGIYDFYKSYFDGIVSYEKEGR